MSWSKEETNAYHRLYWQKNRDKMRELLKQSRKRKNPDSKTVPQRANKKLPEFTTVENELLLLQEKYISLRMKYNTELRELRRSDWWHKVKNGQHKPRKHNKRC